MVLLFIPCDAVHNHDYELYHDCINITLNQVSGVNNFTSMINIFLPRKWQIFALSSLILCIFC